jgi:hypothetical protein
MRYLHTNDDGTIGIWTCVPTKFNRNDGAIFVVSGHDTRQGRTLFFGTWRNLPREKFISTEPNPEFTAEEGSEIPPYVEVERDREIPSPPWIDVGDDQLDIGELQADSVPGFAIEFPDFERDIKAKLAPANRDKVTGHRVCEKREIPADYSFRAAWRDGGNSITHDMDKCREITRARLRAERAPLLAAKDIESIKALESGDVTTLEKIAIEKQQLRDITALPAIDAALTPEELKAIKVPRAQLATGDERVAVSNRKG